MILQHVYAPILNFIYEKITFRIGDRAREIILFVSFFLMFFTMFATMYMHVLSGKERDLIIFLLMGVIILVSTDRRLELLRWRKTIYVPFVLLGLFMLAIAVCLHPIGESYTVFILFILFVTICLAFVWGNRGDYNRLFTLASAAYLLFFVIILVWCFARYGLYFGQHYSMWMNVNGFAKLVCPAMACGMHLFLVTDSRGRKILYAALSGAAGVMAVFSSCRAADMILVVLFIAFIVLLVVKERKTAGKQFLCFLIVFVLGAGVTTGVLHFVTPVITDDPVATHVIVNRIDKSSVEGKERYEYTPYEAYREQVIEEVQSNPTLARLDDLSSGRIHIWAMYLKRANMTGNVKYLKKAGPHNQYVELTYRAGIPAGILWLFVLIAVFVLIVHGIVRRKGDWIYFVTLSYPTFLFFSMLDTGMFPMDRGFIMLYFLSLTPLMIKGVKNGATKNG